MRFDSVKYDDVREKKHENLRKMFKKIDAYIEKNLMQGPSKAILQLQLESCFMWAGRTLKDEQEFEKYIIKE